MSGKGVSCPVMRRGGASSRRKHRDVMVDTISAPNPPAAQGSDLQHVMCPGALRRALLEHTLVPPRRAPLTGERRLVADDEPPRAVDALLHRRHVPGQQRAQVQHVALHAVRLGHVLGRRRQHVHLRHATAPARQRRSRRQQPGQQVTPLPAAQRVLSGQALAHLTLPGAPSRRA